jgi:hypothetical protein
MTNYVCNIPGCPRTTSGCPWCDAPGIPYTQPSRPQNEAMKTTIGLRDERDELRAEIERLQETWLRISKRQQAEIEQLQAAGNEAFLEMCAYRDGGDEECFQDAIDKLGDSLREKT